MNDGPLVYEVGPLTLAFTETPVSERFLEYVRKAVYGEVEAIIPNAAMIGAYHNLRRVYNFRRGDAANIVTNLTESKRIQWYSKISTSNLNEGLKHAHECSIEGWDGYFVDLTIDTGGTLLTIDTGIEELDRVASINPMDEEDYSRLNEYLKAEDLISED